MPELAVPWGDGQLPLALPSHWSLQQVAQPTMRPAEPDWPERLARALGQPEVGLPLQQLLSARRHGQITLVVEDLARHSPLPQILQVLMREIAYARIGPDQVDVVFATGMHPSLTAQQAIEKLGPLAHSLSWRSNSAFDPGAHLRLGQVGPVVVEVDRQVAQADLRVVISSISPHLQAGFGGGYKMLLPGCASLETIRGLHRLGVGRNPRQWVGTEAHRNPMRQAIDAGGLMLDAQHGKTFAVQYLLDDAGQLAHLAVGEMLAAQQMMAKQCAVSCGIVVDQPADVLITNAHPRDLDLWQGLKAVANTRWAVRPGGVIICLARCAAGLGMAVPRWPLKPAAARRVVQFLGHDALASMLTRWAPRWAGDAAFFVRLALQAVHRNPILLVSPRLAAAGARFPALPIYAQVEQAFETADKHLQGRPSKVLVFPSGGTTYPVLPARLNGRQTD
jgi:nickel-dependent lactate racemase